MISEFLEKHNISTMVDLLRHRAEAQPDKTAYIFLADGENEEVKLTYGELDKQARAVAAKLQKEFAPGDRALLLYPPGLEFISGFFGCLYAGIIAVPCYPPDPGKLDVSMAKLRGVMADCAPEVILTTQELLNLAAFIFPDYPDFEKMKWLAAEKIDAGLGDEWKEPVIDGESLAFLQYTSGSTGDPKGVMVSHGNVLYNEKMYKTAVQHSSQAVFAGWIPLYHDMGLIGNVLHSLYLGVLCVLISPIAFLQKPIRWLQMISKYKATISCAPNFAFDLCSHKVDSKQLAELDLSSWEIALNGAEPVKGKTLEEFSDTFKFCGFRKEAFHVCLGMAEATLFICGGLKSASPVIKHVDKIALKQNKALFCEAEQKSAQSIVGCGRTWLDQKIIIVDTDNLTRCSADQIGEIWISGPNVAQGYWNKPELTKDAFQACLADTGEGPFLRTGDLGFMKDDELFVTGRLKDLIIIRGRNHYPQDIELTVEQCHKSLRPGCGAAFSVDVENEERLVVVQEIRKDRLENLDSKKIIRIIVDSIFKKHELRPYAVVLIEPRAIPKTSSGKIQRAACRTMFLEKTPRVVGEWRRDVSKPLNEEKILKNMDDLSEEEIDNLLHSLE